MVSLKDLINQDDGKGVIQRLQDVAWDGKSLIAGNKHDDDDDDDEALHTLLAAVDVQSYQVLHRLLELDGIDVNAVSKRSSFVIVMTMMKMTK